MPKFLVYKSKDYTVMSNYHFREKEMSLKAKGLLSLMLSLPESWDYSIPGLVAICKENRDAIVSGLEELKQFGYLTVEKVYPNMSLSGKIEYNYNIFEFPESVRKEQGVEHQAVDRQLVENQLTDLQEVDEQEVENPQQLNTNKVNTKDKVYNNKIINNNIYNNIYIYIIYYLNSITKNNYDVNHSKNKELILELLSKGYTQDDLTAVIDTMFALWNGSEKAQYLRPTTLFDAEKFPIYLQRARKPKPQTPPQTPKSTKCLPPPQTSRGKRQPNFDVDDFFAKALARSDAELEKYGKDE